jgi:hypothetical protein
VIVFVGKLFPNERDSCSKKSTKIAAIGAALLASLKIHGRIYGNEKSLGGTKGRVRNEVSAGF